MTVYTDPMGHLFADTPDEMHAFARKLHLKPEWFQERGPLSHYDLTTTSAKKRAVDLGAKIVGIRESPKMVRAMNCATDPDTVIDDDRERTERLRSVIRDIQGLVSDLSDDGSNWDRAWIELALNKLKPGDVPALAQRAPGDGETNGDAE
jgi:hypothetical protein